jgi:hypothetical protein
MREIGTEKFVSFAHKKTKDDYKLKDRFYKKDDFQSHTHEFADKKTACNEVCLYIKSRLPSQFFCKTDKMSQNVTKCHKMSQNVTKCHSTVFYLISEEAKDEEEKKDEEAGDEDENKEEPAAE